MNYCCKEVPDVTLILYAEGVAVAKIVLDNLISYDEDFDSNFGATVSMSTRAFNPTDYTTLVTTHNCAYLIERKTVWRNFEGKDETHILPSLTFSKMSLGHNLNAEGDPTTWSIHLTN